MDSKKYYKNTIISYESLMFIDNPKNEYKWGKNISRIIFGSLTIKERSDFLDFVIYDKLTKKALGLDLDGKHYFSSDNNQFDEHLERTYSLKRAGWNVQNIKYWDWFTNDWIEPEEIILRNLRNYFVKYFVESGNIKEDYIGKDISQEFNENNFLSINTLN